MPPYPWENPPSAEWDEGEKIATIKRKHYGHNQEYTCLFHDCDGECENARPDVTYIMRCTKCGTLWRKEDIYFLQVHKRTPGWTESRVLNP